MEKTKINLGPVLKDGFILLTVSTLFVTVCNQFFKGLKKSADTDPIVTSVLQGKLAPVQDLLAKAQSATRANQADHLGRTPLMWAAYANFQDPKEITEMDQKRTPFVEVLARGGADVNARDKDGWTALMWASWSGMPTVASKLLELGAISETRDENGNTALTLATLKGHSEVVKLLSGVGK